MYRMQIGAWVVPVCVLLFVGAPKIAWKPAEVDRILSAVALQYAKLYTGISLGKRWGCCMSMRGLRFPNSGV